MDGPLIKKKEGVCLGPACPWSPGMPPRSSASSAILFQTNCPSRLDLRGADAMRVEFTVITLAFTQQRSEFVRQVIRFRPIRLEARRALDFLVPIFRPNPIRRP